VLSFLGDKLRSCLPLPRGWALLEMPNDGGAIQLRADPDEAWFELPFRGGGYLHLRGPLFERDKHAEELTWHVLRSVVSLRDHPPVLQLKYYNNQPMELAEEAAAVASSDDDEELERPPKKRRVAQLAVRRIIHQQRFAYYQVLSCGVSLLRDPSAPTTAGLVSGVCLLYAHRSSHDPTEGSTVFSIKVASQTPLTDASSFVRAYFRPRGVCEWNGGRCNRHASRDCANACCSAAHCRATSAIHQLPCEEHTVEAL
jgi:hypothetical protein